MSKIDWTKPIEWYDGDVYPATLIGRYNGGYVVGRKDNVCLYNEDGTFGVADTVWIRNVPPPKIEKTVVLLMFKDKSCYAAQPGTENTWSVHNIIAKKTITITEGEGF